MTGLSSMKLLPVPRGAMRTVPFFAVCSFPPMWTRASAY
jgi:hypothetical protein